MGQVLERVLEILQTTELFAPHIHQVKEEDPLTNDYVEGLCDVSLDFFLVWSLVGLFCHKLLRDLSVYTATWAGDNTKKYKSMSKG